jgi:alpha-D-xyloside xylohydrolase
MKFTDGFWQTRPGVTSSFGQEAYDVEATDDGHGLIVTAPTKVIASRGDTLNRPVLTVTLRSPMDGVVSVTVEHFTGGRDEIGFDLVGAEGGRAGVGTVTTPREPPSTSPSTTATGCSRARARSRSPGTRWRPTRSSTGR